MATGVIEMDEVITPTVHADGTEVNQDIAIPKRAIRV
jgi:hypothetical protein